VYGCPFKKRDSSVGIGLEFSLLQIVQTDYGVHPISYPMGTGSSLPGVKRPGREAGHSPPAIVEVKRNVDLYIHYPHTS
jgi:hypothetical protein